MHFIHKCIQLNDYCNDTPEETIISLQCFMHLPQAMLSIHYCSTLYVSAFEKGSTWRIKGSAWGTQAPPMTFAVAEIVKLLEPCLRLVTAIIPLTSQEPKNTTSYTM